MSRHSRFMEEKVASIRTIMAKYPALDAVPAAPPAPSSPGDAFDIPPVDGVRATPPDAPDAPAVLTVPVSQIRPGRFQMRRRFDDAEIETLADSIRAKGVLQPLIVRRGPAGSDSYDLIAGERRWRAARKAQLGEVPVVVRAFSDAEALEVALVENLQREDLTPLEEGAGYQRLIAEFHYNHETLAKALGRSRSHVSNTLRLLDLPVPVKAKLGDGTLTAGHARALLGAPDPAALAEEVARDRLNVRETERLVRKSRPSLAPQANSAFESDDVAAMAGKLADCLGFKVTIRHRGPGGRVEIHYHDREHLDALLRGLHARL
ncbi:MAG: ParB/RepB/Spo0J family partition protein [Alphaproteobacteria bacterium]